MILDGYFVKPGPPPLAHPTDVGRFDSEVAIYKRLGSHERILHCHGLHPTEKAICFHYLPQGDLWSYIAHNGIDNIPYSTRLQWIINVAEGIAFLHLKGVVWIDATPSNMLLTDDLRIVLSDFGGSSMIPEYFPSVRPTGVWIAPPNTRRDPFLTQTRDRFAFGTLVFLLLLGCLPYSDGLGFSSYEEQSQIDQLHESGSFDQRVSNDAYPVLAEVVQKCWRIEYESTEAMLRDVRSGYDACLKLPHPNIPNTTPRP